MTFTLNEHGFIENYLVSGRLETDFYSDKTDKNQLNYEKMLRSVVVDKSKDIPEGEIALGKISPLGLPWEYYYSYGNWFVDSSTFYPLPKKIELYATTILNAPKEMEVEAWLWSFAAIDLWVDGEYVGGIDKPVYKPIKKEILKLKLKKGSNSLFIRLQNLGVRDTRTLFGIQINGDIKENLTITLPDMDNIKPYMEVDRWLSNITLEDEMLKFLSPAPYNAQVIYDSKTVDFTKFDTRFTYQDIGGETIVKLQPGKPYFKVAVKVNNQLLAREFERQEEHQVLYSSVIDWKENQERVFKRIAQTGQIARGDYESFSMYPILARYYYNLVTPEDKKEIYKSLDQIESRRDCSDFLTCAMVRFMKLYPMDKELAARVKEVMLNYRYWMDEDGADGMCFWSENHSLMFYISAYLAGEEYQEEIFIRSGKTGIEMKEQAGKRILQWLSDVYEMGFDEFHSGGYTPITFAALLNVVDFAEEKLSILAEKVLDRLLKYLAIQTFKGVSIAPQGRVYREVLYPYNQDIQCLINLMDPTAPDRFSEWIIFLATSKYKIPTEFNKLMQAPLSLAYEESNGVICVEKQEDYMLTSVQSPRKDGISRKWNNISQGIEVDTGSYHYVKSLNECFHGTTQFEPGVFGYQQHMWYAALEVDTNIFANHPGGSFDGSSMRPGYWYGNGIMPAIKQNKNILYAIYQIPETHPIPFTHLYWPSNRFEEQKMSSGWLVGRKNQGYVGVWCSEILKPHQDQLFNCEFRAISRNAAYVCVCGSQKDYSSLDQFLEYCKSLKPGYDIKESKLTTIEDNLVYIAYSNNTQYI